MADNRIDLTFNIPPEYAGKRIDQVIAQVLTDYSRARIQGWILSGDILVNQAQVKPRDKVMGGEQVDLHTTVEVAGVWEAEAIPLSIAYIDEDLIIVNKPIGLVVHPGAGVKDGTLVNALLHHYPELAALPRAGIIHRLDKNTSGLLIVARSIRAHTKLVKMMAKREIHRIYIAIVNGVMTSGGTVDAPLARHHFHRLKRAVVESGKEAVTHFRILERFQLHTFIQCELETGRTHQIRVHMAHIGFPILGDMVYGSNSKLPQHLSDQQKNTIKGFKRQALHATQLLFEHPVTGEALQFDCPTPDDMQALLTILRTEPEDHVH